MKMVRIKQYWMIRFFLISLLVTLSYCTNAQTFVQDMKNVQDILQKQPLTYSVNYNLFSSHKAGLLIQHRQADFYLWDRLFAFQSEELAIINNDKYSITADHSQKVIVINKANPSLKKTRMKEMEQLANDSVISKIAKFKLITSSDNLRQWRVTYNTPMAGIQYMDIAIKLPEFHIQKMVLYYAASFDEIYGTTPEGVNKSQKPRMEISYQDYKKLAASDKVKYFSADALVTLNKSGKATLKSAYKNYKLANYYKLKS